MVADCDRLARVVSLGSLGHFSDEETTCSSSSDETMRFELERPPGKFGRQSESDGWTEEERVERAVVWAHLSPGAQSIYEHDELLFLRLVRGYWKYEDRTRTVVSVAETVAEMRRRYRCATILQGPLACDPAGAFHRRAWPSWILGRDTYGHPVVLERFSALDWDAALRLTTEELLELRIQALEAMQVDCERWSRRQSHRVYKVVYIVDVGNVNSWALASSRVLEFAKHYAKITEQMFADAVWLNLVVNAPGVARAGWRVVERMVDEETRDIVRFLPTGNSCCAALLDAGVPRECIPDYLGGAAALVSCRLVADVVERLYAKSTNGGGGEDDDDALALERKRGPSLKLATPPPPDDDVSLPRRLAATLVRLVAATFRLFVSLYGLVVLVLRRLVRRLSAPAVPPPRHRPSLRRPRRH
ncbi:hypothetical protein CTAYLR_003938 [Chrysophaeum taylorii]|uniref:CRAL-TRIO domain-containing protein n=1 Tax=Chrysophaeum taylorii TaxID=2483200 RepID=A0AAD7U9F6_9STRA|nr:hypothetical protein CTAYLR_003938 [Chrysophaeum taylorii]